MSPDLMIFLLVVTARFTVPLFIPRFPLPAVIASLVLDAVDQTIFQQFTNLDLSGYQSYDKALDIYYLVIAYISTLKNWTNQFAYKMARFLIYYRLIGVLLYEFLHAGTLLLIFPNTFEYFFITYEAIALRWNPVRLSKKFIVGVTAFIWIFIKLPQEYWIHIAHMDTTEFLNEHLLGEPIDTPIVQSFLMHPEILIPLILIVIGLIFLLWWTVTKKLPKPDWKVTFASSNHIEAAKQTVKSAVAKQKALVSREELIEKPILLALVITIFGQILPGKTVTEMQLILGVFVVVLLNAFVSHQLLLKGKVWASMFKEFAVMAAVNFGLALGYIFLLPSYSGQVNLPNLLFFVLLTTTLLTMYDHYRPVYEARFLAAPTKK